jgi:hypothetical protein
MRMEKLKLADSYDVPPAAEYRHAVPASAPASSDARANTAGAVGRWLLLFLLAGHLIWRREFAHQSLGSLLTLAHWNAPAVLSQAYITEICLLAMLPLALLIWRRGHQRATVPPGQGALAKGFGPALYLCIAMLAWAGGHLVAGFIRQPHDSYLVLRQSALGGYALVFLYAYLFFGDQSKHVRQAAWFCVLTAVVCAALDTAGLLRPDPSIPTYYPGEPLYGQQTLPLGILALGLLVVCSDQKWPLRVLALLLAGFIGWRQSQRVLQSSVILGMAGALALYVVMGAVLAWRGQSNTFKRALLLLGLFGFGACVYGTYRHINKGDSIATEAASEMHAWSPSSYSSLMALYEETKVPDDSTKWVQSRRPPYDLVTDPEVYKLNAVYMKARTSGGVSLVNNIWRGLVWRRMFQDWRDGCRWQGAGVGKAWFYPGMYQSPFHYGEDREGLEPHNSLLNYLYRYGAVGIGLLILLVIVVFWFVFKALNSTLTGEPLLEGIVLFFFYSALFACFNVALEGPSYAMPFWVALGVMYGKARQGNQSRV